MTDRADADLDPFRLWLEASRHFLGTEWMSESLRERCEALFGAWSRFAETYAEAAGAGKEAGGTASGAGPFDPLAWMDTAGAGGLGDLWQSFATGQGWQAEREALTGSREWAAYTLALRRYQAVMAEAWLRAFRRFSEALGREQSDGQPPSWEVIRARWQEASDHELAEAMRGEAFLSAQRDLIRARLDCAALIRDRIERLAELLGMPTRSEMDELGERLHRLEREVRALKAGAQGQE